MNTVGKRWYWAPALLLVAALALALGGLQPAEAKSVKKIKPYVLGMHSDNSDPMVTSGSLRTFTPLWSQIQPSRGTFDWTEMDKRIDQIRSWGYKDILFVFVGTPQWAAGPVRDPGSESFGPGSTSAPTSMSDWKTFVTAVAKRYKGKIKNYQIWNEITSPNFYQGTPNQMAKMTKIAYKAIRSADSKARVISASVQTHKGRQYAYDNVAKPYFKKLQSMNWPVTHVSGHFYPLPTSPGKWNSAGPDERLRQIDMFKKTMKQYRLPSSKEIWDTESNFAVGQPTDPGEPDGRITGNKAATWVARNYLDTWRSGLTRSYWYAWTTEYNYFPGVQLFPGLASTAAFNTFGKWVKGASYKGCSDKGKLVVCKFVKSGKSFAIAFTTKGKSTYTFGGKKSVCPVYGGSCKKVKKKTVVRKMPVKIG